MLRYLAVPFLFTLVATPANSQSETLPVSLTQLQKTAAEREAKSNVELGDPRKQFEQAQAARAVADRHAQLRTDTARLVALTAELKQHVDKAGANILSMDVIKKAQEIQKLAKSVQDKMKYAY